MAGRTRRIYSQGIFDGACFLYAIANAYTALTGRNVTTASWSKAIQHVPYLSDFLSGAVGTDRYRNDPDLLGFAVERMLGVLARGVHCRVEHREDSTLEGIAACISKKSVALFCINHSTRQQPIFDHWVCGVGVAPEPLAIKIACSWRYVATPQECKERRDLRYGRYFNDRLTESDADKVIPRTLFRLALERPRAVRRARNR